MVPGKSLIEEACTQTPSLFPSICNKKKKNTKTNDKDTEPDIILISRDESTYTRERFKRT